jgi:hypothetical protein
MTQGGSRQVEIIQVHLSPLNVFDWERMGSPGDSTPSHKKCYTNEEPVSTVFQRLDEGGNKDSS